MRKELSALVLTVIVLTSVLTIAANASTVSAKITSQYSFTMAATGSAEQIKKPCLSHTIELSDVMGTTVFSGGFNNPSKLYVVFTIASGILTVDGYQDLRVTKGCGYIVQLQNKAIMFLNLVVAPQYGGCKAVWHLMGTASFDPSANLVNFNIYSMIISIPTNPAVALKCAELTGSMVLSP
jgi:hypothetical protein